MRGINSGVMSIFAYIPVVNLIFSYVSEVTLICRGYYAISIHFWGNFDILPTHQRNMTFFLSHTYSNYPDRCIYCASDCCQPFAHLAAVLR